MFAIGICPVDGEVITGTLSSPRATRPSIGDGENHVKLSWSLRNGNSGYFYGSGDTLNTDVAFATGVTDIGQVTDASIFNFTSGAAPGGTAFFSDAQGNPNGIGDFVALRNINTGHYGMFRIDNFELSGAIQGTWWFQTDGSASFTESREPKLFGLSIGVNDGQLRSDITAQQVFSKLSSRSTWASPSDGNTTQALTLAGSANTGVESLISSSLNAMQPQSGDTVVFYFGGHGSTARTGDETPVSIINPPSDSWAGSFAGDESLKLGSYRLTDDALTAMFSDPKWEGVQKVFILDSCFSGGFAGGNSPADSGDFSALGDDVVLFAAASEGGFTFYDKSDGLPIYSKFLIPQLDNESLSFAQFRDQMNLAASAINERYGGTNQPGLEEFAVGEEAPFSYNPFFYSSPNVDLSKSALPVPEPATGILLLSALGFTIHRRRRI